MEHSKVNSQGITRVKCLATILVVLIHVVALPVNDYGKADSLAYWLTYSLGHLGVPLFVMCSGALLLQEKKRAAISQAKLNEKMDVMNVMVSGADMIREDVLEMLEFEYRRLDIKAKNDDATYRKNKRNLDRLAKCYAQMKASMHTFECEYRKFIDYWNAEMFADEKGVFSPEFDKHTHNIGFCTYLFFCMYEKLFMSAENAERLIETLNDMKGKDIWDEGDLKRYLIKI